MALEVCRINDWVSEVRGLQLWDELEAATFTALQDLWRRTGVLLFRRQALSEPELVNFSRRFGTPDAIVRKDWQSDAEPSVIRISNMKDASGRSIGGLGTGELDWHTDQSYMASPATGSILYMVEMPAEPPHTFWLSLRDAYQKLPQDLQRQCADLWVIHDYFKRQATYNDEPSMSAELRRKTPPVRHKLVQTDPCSGQMTLYYDPTTAVGVKGMAEADGTAFLRQLTDAVLSVTSPYRHDWQIGDVIMWDNGVMWHRRDAFQADGCRLLKRTTLQLPADRHLVPRGDVVVP